MLKKILVSFALLMLLFPCLPGFGEGARVGAAYNPGTGDARLDTTLGDINIRTRGKNLDDFISNLSMTYNIPSKKIEVLINEEGMTPADVYMAAGLANIANRPVDEVAHEYDRNKGKGWGAVAKRLGIKPGSKEFHALKEGGAAFLDNGKQNGKNKSNGKNKKHKNKARNKK